MSNYLELLKDPKWQKKRLFIFERDNYQCQCCFDKKTTLVVHHKRYDRNKNPWEYENDNLITLCEDCHKIIHDHGDLKYESGYYLEAKGLKVNLTDYIILRYRIKQIANQGRIKEAIQLLTSNMITEEEI